MLKLLMVVAVAANIRHVLTCDASTVCNNPNEVFDDCPAPCPPRECGVDPALVLCQPSPKKGDPECEPGCRCADDYVRNDSGICVTRDQCPPTTSDSCNGDGNATSGCGVPCKNTCQYYNSAEGISCIQACFPDGCDCKPGYVFDDQTSKCVLPEDCQTSDNYCKGDSYAEPGCGNYCGSRCADVNSTGPGACSQACLVGGCDCKQGFYLNPNTGQCVAPGDCPSPTPPNSCNDINATPGCGINCQNNCQYYNSAEPRFCGQACLPDGCDCNPGYVYDDQTGKCVLPRDCQPSDNYCMGDDKKIPGCSNYCRTKCSDVNNTGPVACSFACLVGGCDCKEGYYLEPTTGQCVTADKCQPNCPPYEEYSTCTQGVCRAQTCDQVGKPVACPAIAEGSCIKGCVCQEGYVRNEQGDCVAEDQCSSSGCNGDRNATSGCGVPCENTCQYYNAADPIACIDICYTDGCDCKQNYVYDDIAKKCVLPQDCLLSNDYCKGDPNAKPGCGVYCNSRCSDLNSTEPEQCLKICYIDSCDCKENFYLDENSGKCVAKENCPPSCPTNEYYSTCIQGECRALNCTQVGQPIACPRVREGFCIKGCVCNVGYARDENGTCIPENQCYPCPDEEQYSTCPPSDSELDYCQTTSDPPVSSTVCGTPRCVCGFNRKRDPDTNNCIAIADCPPFPCDGQNEEYQSCPPGCPGDDCSDYINNNTCQTLFRIGIVVPCQPACRCKENYYRNSDGICVDGAECQKSCPEGEQYNECPPSNIELDYCQKTRDPLISTTQCGTPRCTCGFNSKRDPETNECIATADCPPFPCDGQNEEYQSCPPVCPGQECADYINNSTCPKYHIGIVVPCQPACRCQDNYYRNSNSQCVDGAECLKCN